MSAFPKNQKEKAFLFNRDFAGSEHTQYVQNFWFSLTPKCQMSKNLFDAKSTNFIVERFAY